MTHDEIVRMEERHQLRTYRKKPIAAVRGEGCWIFDAEDRRFMDLYGGHCVALLGHNHPVVTKALKHQLDQILFYSNAVYSPVRARAARALSELAPKGLGTVFFCSTGTEANETALKLARKSTGRSVVAAMEGGFHGRTLGSLAVTHGKYREPYREALGPTVFMPFGDVGAMQRTLAARRDIAAVIVEPIQSMAGVTTADAEYFLALRETCSEHGVVLVFDEIQTGVGRTGTFSISERYGMTPDVISLAKSLGNGVPVGACLVSDELAEQVAYGDQGTTFGGGMLAMAAVEATLGVLRDEDIMGQATRFESSIRHLLGPKVREIRGAGCLLGLDLGFPAAPVIAGLFERRILVGGANDPNVIRLMPPAVTPPEAIEEFAQALDASLAQAPRLA